MLKKFIVFCLWFGLFQLAMAQVATVQSTRGTVEMQTAAGATSALVQGATVPVGSQVTTGASSQVLLRFLDGHMLALKENSSVKIDSYVYDSQTPANSSFVTSLLRGGLRSVTGLLGKANHGAVAVNTPVALIGIRGSDWMAAMSDSASAPAAGASAGAAGAPATLSTQVTEGGITVNSSTGSLLVDAGQAASTTVSASSLVSVAQLPAGIFGTLPDVGMTAGIVGGSTVATGSGAAVGALSAPVVTFGAIAAAAAVQAATSSSSNTGTTGTTR